ncbi:MAG: hypothetical protein ACREH4_08220 [Vitreimonas sp.]
MSGPPFTIAPPKTARHGVSDENIAAGLAAIGRPSLLIVRSAQERIEWAVRLTALDEERFIYRASERLLRHDTGGSVRFHTVGDDVHCLGGLTFAWACGLDRLHPADAAFVASRVRTAP